MIGSSDSMKTPGTAKICITSYQLTGERESVTHQDVASADVYNPRCVILHMGSLQRLGTHTYSLSVDFCLPVFIAAVSLL